MTEMKVKKCFTSVVIASTTTAVNSYETLQKNATSRLSRIEVLRLYREDNGLTSLVCTCQ